MEQLYDVSYNPELSPSIEYEGYYFEWIVGKIQNTDDPFSKVTYNKLLRYLHEKEYTYIIPMDENREEDGISLRSRFCYECGYDSDVVIPYISKPCSVLEMMVALALRMEEGTAMNDELGDRTGQWFWSMVNTMHLGYQDDNDFDSRYADIKINNMLERNYKPDGDGGLFKIEGVGEDMRNIEIWMQACWYLDIYA